MGGRRGDLRAVRSFVCGSSNIRLQHRHRQRTLHVAADNVFVRGVNRLFPTRVHGWYDRTDAVLAVDLYDKCLLGQLLIGKRATTSPGATCIFMSSEPIPLGFCVRSITPNLCLLVAKLDSGRSHQYFEVVLLYTVG